MAQETTNNALNDPTMTSDKSFEKLALSTDLADNNFFSSDVDNCSNNFKRSEKKNAKKNIVIISANRLLIVGDSIVKT